MQVKTVCLYDLSMFHIAILTCPPLPIHFWLLKPSRSSPAYFYPGQISGPTGGEWVAVFGQLCGAPLDSQLVGGQCGPLRALPQHTPFQALCL